MPVPLQFASFHCSQEVFIWPDGISNSRFHFLIGYVISVRDTEEFAETSHLQCLYPSFNVCCYGPRFTCIQKYGHVICRYLTEKNTVQLVCSFVLSRLDYCNATLADLPATHIACLQRIQNNAARLVLQKSKRQHVTPLLKQLQWLPIQTRIDYKLATLAFRHFDGSLPQYLSSRLDIYQPSRSLRSSNDRLLRVPRWKLKSFGYRSFSYQGPVVWNSLPTDLKLSSSLSTFKSRLKTHLFKKSYSLC